VADAPGVGVGAWEWEWAWELEWASAWAGGSKSLGTASPGDKGDTELRPAH